MGGLSYIVIISKVHRRLYTLTTLPYTSLLLEYAARLFRRFKSKFEPNPNPLSLSLSYSYNVVAIPC